MGHRAQEQDRFLDLADQKTDTDCQKSAARLRCSNPVEERSGLAATISSSLTSLVCSGFFSGHTNFLQPLAKLVKLQAVPKLSGLCMDTFLQFVNAMEVQN